MEPDSGDPIFFATGICSRSGVTTFGDSIRNTQSGFMTLISASDSSLTTVPGGHCIIKPGVSRFLDNTRWGGYFFRVFLDLLKADKMI